MGKRANIIAGNVIKIIGTPMFADAGADKLNSTRTGKIAAVILFRI
jgi:hypothetical protein